MNLLEEKYGAWDGFEYRSRRNKQKELIFGNGINDAPFVVRPTISGKRIVHPAFSYWYNMLNRSYNPKYKEKNATYLEVTCCKEWLLFTNFAIWFKGNYIEGYQLDKDLLVKDNKIYSPNNCIFIPQKINSFLTLSNAQSGKLPIGVTLHKGRFISRISTEGTNLGSFDTPELAHKAWQKVKLEQAIAFNFTPLQRVIDQLKFEIKNNLETLSL